MGMGIHAALLKLHAAADAETGAQRGDFVESEYFTEQVENIS